MFNILPLIILLLALAAIVMVVVRKLPQVAAMDVAAMPAVAQQETKRKILHSRIERRMKSTFSSVVEMASRVATATKKKTGAIRDQIRHMEQMMEKQKELREEIEEAPQLSEEEKKIKLLLAEAEEFFKQERYAESEQKYIEVISLNPRAMEAYRGLGELYLFQNEFDQARETFSYILKLNPTDHQAEFELAEVYDRLGDLEQAIAHTEKALEYEPEYIKYLDFLLNLSITAGDKKRAQVTLDSIADINPENAKLTQWQRDIDAL